MLCAALSGHALLSLTMSLKPIDKAGHCGNLTAVQEKTLHEFEERLTQDGVLPDALLDSDEQRTTVLL